LKGVIIPAGVEYINDSAFCGCHFSSIVVPSSVKEIGQYAFSTRYACYASIPETVQKIADNAFEGIERKTTIYGVADSEAARVAIENSITFVEFKDIVYGDVDDDGAVTIADYSATKSCVSGVVEFEGCAEIIGDMNSDQVIDAFDLFQIDRTVNSIN
jgi:hypothetical protein